MTSQNAVSVIHPAEIIQDEMRERGWNLDKLVRMMNPFADDREKSITKLSFEMYFAVREPYVMLGEKMAAQLAIAFGVDSQFFINLHENWRKAVQA